MSDKGYRKWRPLAGVLAVGMLAFGLSLEGAPAGDSATAGSADRAHKKVSVTVEDTPRYDAVLPAAEEEPSFAATARPVVTKRVQLRSGWMGAIAETSVQPISRGGSRSANEVQACGDGVCDPGETVNDGGGHCPADCDCTCDDHCIGLNRQGDCIYGQCIDGDCEDRDQPTDTYCEDGVNYCTIGRCDAGAAEVFGDATCVDPATVVEADGDLSRCAKECVGGADDGYNCYIGRNCSGGDGCTLKPGVSCVVVGSDYECRLDPEGTDTDVGRCCEVATGDPGYVSSTVCTGQTGKWLEITDPDHLMHYNGTDPRCPHYSSGIAPEGTWGTEIGPVLPPPNECSFHLPVNEHGAPCEVAGDCYKRCVGGGNDGEPCLLSGNCDYSECDAGDFAGNECDDAGDCEDLDGTPHNCVYQNTGTCDADTCVDNPEDCHGGYLSLGDDYSMFTNRWIRLEEIRWRGGVAFGGERIAFDFLDENGVRVRTFKRSAITGSPGGAGNINEAGIATYRMEVDCGTSCDVTQPCDANDTRCELRREEYFAIPPKGYIVMRAVRFVSTERIPIDLTGYWVPTDAADVGFNDPNVMWVDGAVLSGTETEPLEQGDRVLTFELIGDPLHPTDESVIGACCRPGSTCVDVPQHLCRYCAGELGTHTDDPCDRGVNGDEASWSGIDRDCPDAPFEACQTNYWHGNRSHDDFIESNEELCASGKCDNAACCDTDGTCTVVAVGDCTATELSPGTSCSDDSGETPPPWEPNCCPQDVDLGGSCCADLYQCNISGDWCNPLDSHSCDPIGTNGPCELVCDGATVIELVVPPAVPLGQRNVYNIVTDTRNAEWETEDDCQHGSDPGWYVAWHVSEACAIVTLNLCCTEPIMDLNYSVPGTVCPCLNPGPLIQPNAQRYGYGSDARNNYWCEDGNFSVEWTLPTGTYNYTPQAGSVCAGTNDDCGSEADCPPGVECRDYARVLNFHLVVEPCPQAACCYMGDLTDCETVSCVVNSEVECQAIFGDWLGALDPNPIATCTPVNPCTAGACCSSAAECRDDDGNKVTCPECRAMEVPEEFENPVYHGGVTCAESPCAVCPFEDPAHCQEMNGDYIFVCDRNNGVRAADDFMPAVDGVLERVCYWHGYVVPQGGSECANNPPDDDLEIHIYEDMYGIPGTEIAGSPGAGAQWDARGPQPGLRTWRYSAPIPAGAQVFADTCYWIEITGAGRSDCEIDWSESRSGNNFRVRDDNNSWGYEDYRQSDLAFCLDLGIKQPTTPWVDGGCGDIPVACCTPGPTCQDTTVSVCRIANGIFFPTGTGYPYQSCDDVTCPVPLNDNCEDNHPSMNICERTCRDLVTPALSSHQHCLTTDDCPGTEVCTLLKGNPDPLLGSCQNSDNMIDGPVCNSVNSDCYDGSDCWPWPEDAYRCVVDVDSRLATTDGGMTFGGCWGSGAWALQADVWYRLTAPCTGNLVMDMCNAQSSFDSMVAVFGNGTADMPCPGVNNLNAIQCDDDFCPGSGTVSGLPSQQDYTLDVFEDAVYILRMGGWSSDQTPATADQGESTYNIGWMCAPPITVVPPDLPATAQHQTPKIRHISMDMTANGAAQVAYEVSVGTMNRCDNDPRRACNVLGDCPGVCSGDNNLQCASDTICINAGVGTCIIALACEAAADVGQVLGYVDVPIAGDDAACPTAGAGYTCCVPLDDCAGMWFATLSDAPVYRVWTEDLVHVLGCEISPNVVYDVVGVVLGTGDRSVPLAIGTVSKPTGLNYGDVASPVGPGGVFQPPDGYVNISDIQAYIFGVQKHSSAPHTTWIDLHNNDDPTVPQQILNIADMSVIKAGLLGDTYVERAGQYNPASCP